MTIGIIIFLVAYALIVSEKMDKSIPAILGAAAMVFFGVAEFPELLRHIDLNVLGLLIGMMLIVNIMGTTGVFEWVAVVIARQTRGNGVLVLIEFLLATALISAFMDNVTTIILMAPVTILITQLLSLPTVPFLILEAVFSNIGGTATLIGDPPNILIGAGCKLSFNDFIINLGPVVLLIMLVSAIVVVVYQRRRLKTSAEAIEQVAMTEPGRAILHPKRLKYALGTFGLVLLGFFFSRMMGIEPGLIAIAGGFVMAMVCGIDVPHMLEKVEWCTILFFCGLFMMVGALEVNGVFITLGNWMVELTKGDFGLTMMIILWGGAMLSAIVDNIPLVIAMIPLINSIIPAFARQMGLEGAEEISRQVAQPLFWALALGACLGGNGTLIGASANVVISQIARKNNYVLTFKQFTCYGFPMMLLSLVISSIYLYLRYLN